MPRTLSRDPLQQFRFRVAIVGWAGDAGFMKAEGLESEIDVVEYREGGRRVTWKLPGGIEKTGTLSLEKGVFKNNQLYNLFRKTLENPNFRATILVTEQNRLGVSVRRWTLKECWVSKLTGPSFDANATDVSVEKIEIQYEEIECNVVL